MSAQHIEEVQENQVNKTAAALSEHIGHQPPHLTFENQSFVETKQIIKKCAVANHRQQNNDRIAQGNVQHQVGDAFVPVAKEKPIDSGA